MSLHAVPRLPPELEARCFILAARMHHEIGPTLLLVTSRVYEWIQPIVYETVDVAGSETRFSAFVRALETKPCQFQQHVKDLDLDASFLSNEERIAFLLRLTGLVDLAIRGDEYRETPAQLTLIRTISQLKLQRLIFESPMSHWTLLNVLTSSLTLPPLSYSLTHLCLFSPISFLPTYFLAYFPALTHLAVQAVHSLFHRATGSQNRDSLQLLERLSVVVFICLSQEEIDLISNLMDRKNVSRDNLAFILATLEFYVDFNVASTWGWRKQDDIWEEADRVFESRRLSHSR